jgi:hypothetical protein
MTQLYEQGRHARAATQLYEPGTREVFAYICHLIDRDGQVVGQGRGVARVLPITRSCPPRQHTGALTPGVRPW